MTYRKFENWWKNSRHDFFGNSLRGKFIFEFIVILFSISVAVSVDGYLERRNDYKTELGLLEESKGNLEVNVNRIERNIRQETKTVESTKRVLFALDTGNVKPLSLIQDYKWIAWVESLELQTSGYSALKSFGFRKMENDILRKEIINLYEVEYPKLVERTFTTSSVYRDLMNHEIYKKFRYDLNTKSYIPNNYDSLRTDLKFRNMISFSLELKNWRIKEKDTSVARTKRVIALIDKEINSIK